MKKFVAIAAVLALVSPAMAATTTLYFTGGSCGGSNALWLAPPSSAIQTEFSTGALTLSMDVAAKGDGCGDETLSSLGLDLDSAVTSGDGTVNLDSATYFNTAAETGATEAPWSGVNTADTDDLRGVAVPDSAGSTLWNGYCPGLGYTAGQLDVSANNDGTTRSVSSVTMKVGLLKITRVYNPGSTNPGTPELVAFGAGDADSDGSVVGDTDANADASVVVRKKYDFGGFDPDFIWQPGLYDNSVDFDDIFYAYDQIVGGTLTGEDAWAGDVGGFDPDFVWQPGATFADCVPDFDDVFYAYDNMVGS
jgi:hypothetical protein